MRSLPNLPTCHGIALVAFAAAIPIGEGLAFGALGLFAALTLARWRELVRALSLTDSPLRAVLLGLGLWLAAGLTSLWIGGHGWLKPSELGLWSPLLVIPLIGLGARLIEDRWLTRAGVAFVAALAAAAAFGLVQFAFDARPAEELFRFSAARTMQMSIPSEAGGTVAGGFFFHRLKMAHVLLIGVGILVSRQLLGSLSWRRRLGEGLGLTLLGAALVLTYTRGALLAALVAAAACLPFASRQLRWASLCAAALAGAAAMTVPTVRQRVLSVGGTEASSVRGFVWSRGTQVLADHPLGIGLGNYPPLIGRYYDISEPHFDVRTYPHNVVLAALAETGPVGMVGYFGAWTAVLVACLGTLRRERRGRRALAAAAGVFGLTAFWIVGMTHDVLFHKPVNLAFCALVGWVLAVLGPTPAADAPTPRPLGRWRWGAAFVAAAPAVLLIAGADLPPSWLLVGAAVAAVGATGWRWASWAALLASSVLAYLGAASVQWTPATALAPLAGLSAVIVATSDRRRQLTWLAVTVLLPLVVVAAVIERTASWPTSASFAWTVVASLSLAGTAGLAMWLAAGENNSTGRGPRRWAAGLVATLALVGALRPAPTPSATALPAWRAALASLDEPMFFDSSTVARTHLLGQLESLRAAGIREASLAWAAQALLENADPELLRTVCPEGGRSASLAAPWRGWVEAGRLACTVATADASFGARQLATLDDESRARLAAWEPAFSRLRGDLLLAAGDPEAAFASWREAWSAGDPHAHRVAAQAAATLGGTVPVADALPWATDPLVDLWLDPQIDTPTAWQAWNDAFDLTRLGPTRRFGVVAADERRELKQIFGVTPYLAVTGKTAIGRDPRVRLPLPPGRRVPEVIQIRARSRYGLRLTLITDDGKAVAFSCPPLHTTADTPVVPIVARACAAEWDEVTIRSTDYLGGRLRAMYLDGYFDLAGVQLHAGPLTPTD